MSMASALDVRHRTLAEFLTWEEQQPERYERVGGVIRMMTGGTVAHNRITRNCARALETRLLGSDCEVFTSDIKVVAPEEDVMYPDVVVVCGAIAAEATRLETPVVVVEVLSESTAARDHGPKRWAYQTIPSLQHFVLIDQTSRVVEVASMAMAVGEAWCIAGLTCVCDEGRSVSRLASTRFSPGSPSRPPQNPTRHPGMASTAALGNGSKRSGSGCRRSGSASVQEHCGVCNRGS
jgi:Uma2 family endonuclease